MQRLPKESLKKYCKFALFFIHANPSFMIEMSKERTTRRDRLLTLTSRTAGLPTGSGMQKHTLRFYLCLIICN